MNHKYRSKPVEIEAFQMTMERRWNNIDWPEWLNRAWNLPVTENGALFPSIKAPDALEIRTMEGVMLVPINDWIIRGTEGELYPCKPSVFERKYEKVGDAECNQTQGIEDEHAD